MKRQDRSYFRRRANTERGLAVNARHPNAARVHDQLAIEYEDRLRSGYSGLLLIDDDGEPAGQTA